MFLIHTRLFVPSHVRPCNLIPDRSSVLYTFFFFPPFFSFFSFSLFLSFFSSISFRRESGHRWRSPVLTKLHGEQNEGVISSWFAWVSLQAHIIRVFVPRHERTLSVRFTASETPPRRHNSYALPVPLLILPCGPLEKIITVRNTVIYPKTFFSLLYFFFFIWKRNPLLAKLPRCRLNGTIDLQSAIISSDQNVFTLRISCVTEFSTLRCFEWNKLHRLEWYSLTLILPILIYDTIWLPIFWSFLEVNFKFHVLI